MTRIIDEMNKDKVIRDEIREKYGVETVYNKPFVKSCFEFYKKNKYLSSKQVSSLNKIQDEITLLVMRHSNHRPRKNYKSDNSEYDFDRSFDSDFASCFDWGSQ